MPATPAPPFADGQVAARAAAPPALPRDAAADLYGWFATLSPEEDAVRLKVREFMERRVRPIANDYWERGEFYHEVVPEFVALDLLRDAYDPAVPNATVRDCLISGELARVDPSMATFYGVHAGLCMGSIALHGSDEQKAEWLPKLRRWEAIGGFGLTEPEVGSGVARGLTTTCRRDGDAWVLNGQKKWIGNATFGDVVVVWARDEDSRQVKGFIVRTRHDDGRTHRAGYGVETMRGKIAQRAVQNGLITLTDLRVPESDRLQKADTFAATQQVLGLARCGTAWQGVGCAMGAFEAALGYAAERTQFGRPIGAFQLVQVMLVKMAGNLTAMLGLALRAARLQDAEGMRDERSALAKQFCAARCREVVGLARELMGGNGILLEYGAARLFADAEAIYSYEGSNEINSLIVGRALTGVGAFV
ncbi:glutaryl-CoA dehydrogenase [Gemmatimonadetes bacterium T265]|nr:glutaryl-CoA dehydrogenase [Gemmatimonadetes bacterium T265]